MTDLGRAYLTTIDDFERAFRSTGVFEFETRRKLLKEIHKYENLLEQEKNK